MKIKRVVKNSILLSNEHVENMNNYIRTYTPQVYGIMNGINYKDFLIQNSLDLIEKVKEKINEHIKKVKPDINHDLDIYL